MKLTFDKLVSLIIGRDLCSVLCMDCSCEPMDAIHAPPLYCCGQRNYTSLIFPGYYTASNEVINNLHRSLSLHAVVHLYMHVCISIWLCELLLCCMQGFLFYYEVCLAI